MEELEKWIEDITTKNLDINPESSQPNMSLLGGNELLNQGIAIENLIQKAKALKRKKVANVENN